MSQNDTGVVDPPDGGFEIGQEIVESASAGLDALIDIVASFFKVYLLTSTMFLLTISVLFVVIYFIGKWPSQYGTQLQLRRTKRSFKGLLLLCGLFPILYAAGWIGTGATSHDGLPEDGIFGTGFEDRIIGVSVGSDGLAMFIDVVSALFRMYLASITTAFIILSTLFIASHILGRIRSYGTELQQDRTRRSLWGLFLVSIILPLLYVPVWIAEGTQSPGGYNLASDGVFGTSIEDRIFGPEVGEGGFGQLVSILANIFHTYQVTISFFLIVFLIFLGIGYALVQWPNELKNRGFRDRLERVGLGLLASISFIPVLYAVGWVATGLYTPDESMTWVAPPIQLPYEELFNGPDYHPFIQDLSANSDPLAVVLRNVLDFQSLTLVYVGIAAVVTGLLVYTVFSHSNYIDTELGERSFRGGVIILLIAFMIPFVVTGAAWVATGVPSDGYMGDGPPGFSSQCTAFETSNGGWETTEGRISPVAEPYGIELHGTISQEFEEVGMGDRSVTIRPISSDKEFQIRMYAGGEQILNQTAEHSASYIVGTDDDVRVEVESDGGQINELCVGFEPVSDPQLDIALEGVAEEKPLILRHGITMEYTVYNVGEVHTGSKFDVHLVLNGTDPWGESSSADSETTLPAMAGGKFTDQVNRFDDLEGTPPTGRVKMIGYVDPYNQLDERTTVPNIDDQYINVVYANMYGHIDATAVNNNATDIQTRTVNNGTIYSDPTTANVTIYDEDNGGQPVRSWTVPVAELSAGESQSDSFNHTFRAPGNYTAEINVDEFLFPRGSIEQDSLQFIAPDLHGNLVGVGDETRVDTPTNFTVSVQNKGNDRFDDQTNATVQLVDSTGTVTQEEVLTVPSLDEGEYYNRTLQMTPQSGGMHTVNLDVNYSLYPYGTTDSEEILSIGPSFNADVNSPNVFQTEGSDITASVTNNGNADSRPSQMDAVLTHPNGTELGNKTYEVPALEAGETHTVESPFNISLNDSGKYGVEMDVDETLSTTGANDTTFFEVYSFNINADATPIQGTNDVRFDVSLENLANSSTGTNKDVDVTVRNSSNGIVSTGTITFPSLNGGEEQTRNAVLELDNAGSHTGVVELQVGKQDTDTVEFNHSWPDPNGNITATQTSVSGDQTTVQTNVTNTGSVSSNATSATVRVYDVESGRSRVYTTTVNVPSLDPGESHTVNATIEFPDEGVYEAEIDVSDADLPGNNVDTTDEIQVFQSEIRVRVEPHRNNVPSGENGTVDVIVSNVGSNESGTLPVQTEFTSPNGQTVAIIDGEVDPIAPGENTTITHTAELSTLGTHTVESTVTSEISGEVRNSTQIEVVEPYLVNVTPNQSQVPVGSESQVTVSIKNVGSESRGPNSVVTQYTYPNGTNLAKYNKSVPQLEPGEEHRFQVNATLDTPGVHDVEGRLLSNQSTVTDTAQVEAVESDLAINVNAEQDQIGASDDGVLLAEISNIGTKQSPQRAVTVEFEYENGTVVDQWETTVQSLSVGDSTTLRLSSDQLNNIGEYNGTVQVEAKNSGWITDSALIEVSPSSLSADVTANNVEEGNPVDITTTIENTGLSTSNSTTATVRIEQSGSTVIEQTFDVQELESGESQTNSPFNTNLEPGDYDVYLNVNSGGGGVQAYDQFEVGYWDLKGELVVSDERRSNQHEITVRVPNEGSVQSNSTTATVNITGPSGSVVKQQQIDVPSISGGNAYTHDVSLVVDEGGEYTAQLNVRDPARPAGTTDQANFVITWGNLSTSLTVSDVVQGNESDFEVSVENTGPGESYPTTGTVNVRDNFGNIIEQYTVEIPALEPGESYETTVTHQFERPGTYSAEIDVDYPQFPEGTVDTKGEMKVVHGNLNGRIYFSYGSSDVGTETPATVQITNAGNDISESTTADVWVENRHGETVYSRTVDVSELQPGDSDRWELDVLLNTSGTHTAYVDANDPTFPIGNQGQDDIEVVSPDLQTSLTVGDTRIGEQANVTIDIVNEGGITAESTIVDVIMYNDENKQVVHEELGVQRLGPGESVTIEYSQLIAAECWRTEMTCEPGATIDYGSYSAVANAEVQYAEEGTVGEDTFEVEEKQN